MSKIETVCPFCKKPTVVEKSSFGALADGLQNIQCPHCSKRWAEDLSVTGKLAKSAPAPSTEAPAPSTELAELRVQLNAQFAELLSKIKGLTERRVAASRPAKFNTNGREVEKGDIAAQELEKALANGTPVTFQSAESTSPRFQAVESVGSGRRVRSGQPFDTNGIEKSNVADVELQRALASGKPVGFAPHGN